MFLACPVSFLNRLIDLCGVNWRRSLLYLAKEILEALMAASQHVLVRRHKRVAWSRSRESSKSRRGHSEYHGCAGPLRIIAKHEIARPAGRVECACRCERSGKQRWMRKTCCFAARATQHEPSPRDVQRGSNGIEFVGYMPPYQRLRYHIRIRALSLDRPVRRKNLLYSQ